MRRSVLFLQSMVVMSAVWYMQAQQPPIGQGGTSVAPTMGQQALAVAPAVVQPSNATPQPQTTILAPSQTPAQPVNAPVAQQVQAPVTVQPLVSQAAQQSVPVQTQAVTPQPQLSVQSPSQMPVQSVNEPAVQQVRAPVSVQPAASPATSQPVPVQTQAVAPVAVTPQATASAPVPSAPAQAQPQISLTMPVQNPAAQEMPASDTSKSKDEEDVKGISTLGMDEPQGNWLYKRLWWQRAEQQYEKTKGLVDAIMEARIGFFARRTELDRVVLDPFYLEFGLSRGMLEEVIETLVTKSQEKRAQVGDLSPEERSFFSLIEAEKQNLEQLQKDNQKINETDHAIDDSIDTLIKQINQARNFERQSWRNFKQIAQELSDKKARELYYGMVTYFQNINEIVSYIQGPLSQHFNQLESLAKDQISKVQQAMKILKEKGVDFKKQSQQFDDAHKECKVEPEKPVEKAVEPGILGKAWNGIVSVAGYVGSAVKGVWNYTLGRFFAAKKVEAPVPETPQPPAPVAGDAAQPEQKQATDAAQHSAS